MKKSTQNTATKNSGGERAQHQPTLLLIEDTPKSASQWVLDEETRKAGRKGLAKARAALQATRPAHLDAAA